MNVELRIKALSRLGNILKSAGEDKKVDTYSLGVTEKEYEELIHLVNQVSIFNGWFTPDEVKKSIRAWGKLLTEENLNNWLNSYTLPERESDKVVGIIMAGNIPLVGFHDFVSTYLLGFRTKIKMSSDDDKLFPLMLKLLSLFDPEAIERTEFVTAKLEGFDAIIATGSNNTSRYFEQYFGKYPHIIRKSRTSVAVLSGDESEEELRNLAEDIFAYYGLGCRNVTKVYVPQGFDLNCLFKAFYDYKYVIDNNKYANNYDYHKAIYLMEQYELLENGFILVRQEQNIHSPIGTLNYEEYVDRSMVLNQLESIKDQIQCIVAKDKIPFGKAQTPELWDYADNVDTIKFLISL